MLYGKNEGLKTECINEILKRNDGKVFNYDENQIKDQTDSFYENLLSDSLFESTKIILINRASDKIYNIVLDLIERNITNAKIIINAGVLETRSKLRSLFEKNKKLICVPTYKDNNETLSRLTSSIFKKDIIIPIPLQFLFLNVENGFLILDLLKQKIFEIPLRLKY